MMAPVPVRVECHSGCRGEAYPTAVHLEGQRRTVTEILDRWYEGGAEPGAPAVGYFKVRTPDRAPACPEA
ncbi:MAG: hypothetical protein JW820_13180 [Spirochaetales bacterium]|nr:hypothetical protein [Spirochaetales bacterium]